MYKSFYGLSSDPFLKSIETKEHFKSKDFNDALSRLEFLKILKVLV